MEEPRYFKRNRDRWELDRIRFHLDRPPAPKRQARSLQDILPDVVDGLEMPQSETVLVLQKAWAQLCGGPIAKHSTPGFIKDKILFVRVDHPGWLPELERIKRMLLGKIQSRFRELNIHNLRFILEHSA